MQKDTAAKSHAQDLSFLYLSLPPQPQSDQQSEALPEAQWDLPTRSRDLPSPRTDLRSAAPIFTPRFKNPFEGERPEHRRYLEQFHIKKCDRDCPGASCINAHMGESLRRPLQRRDSGQWNYASATCSTPHCCSPTCAFSHTYEERLYHPDMYKTNYCAFQLAERGCQGYGPHCPFAHSPVDLRLSSCKQSESAPSDPCKQNVDNGFYDLSSYKINRCPDSACKKKPCRYFHSPFDRRRDPSQFPYLSMPCKNVYHSPTKKFIHPDHCKNGDACKYSHTKFEAYYHPAFYKTQYCTKLLAKGTCDRGESCAFLHPEQPQSKSLLSQLLRSKEQLAAEHSTLKQEFEFLKEEMTRLKKKLVCPRCRQSDKGVYLSCGHLLCQSCSAQPCICPVCAVECSALCALRL